MVISLFSNWMLVMATKVGPSAPGFEAWAAVDHQDYRAINWSNHNLTSTQSNRRVWIMPWLYIFYIHGVDCKRSESDLLLCALYLSHLKTCSMQVIMIRRLKYVWRKCDTLWHSRRIISITSVSSDTFDTTCTMLCHKYCIQHGCTPEKIVHT